jgi:hypothetical protein
VRFPIAKLQLQGPRLTTCRKSQNNSAIPRRSYIPLPPSPLGLSNYDAFDLEDEMSNFSDDHMYSDGDEAPLIYSDFNILDPQESVVAVDYDALDDDFPEYAPRSRDASPASSPLSSPILGPRRSSLGQVTTMSPLRFERDAEMDIDRVIRENQEEIMSRPPTPPDEKLLDLRREKERQREILSSFY